MKKEDSVNKDKSHVVPFVPPANFIRTIVAEDIEANKNDGKIVTRFPPEPNGFLHIGHAKAICLDFNIAMENNGICHLRMDDTNPSKEEEKFVNAITDDIKWLGFDWGNHLYHTSDYYEKLYQYAIQLIKKGKAYVCDLTSNELKEYRGTLKMPGKESPWRNRSVDENLDLFKKMRNGEFKDGEKLLRAKIDMAAGNINMRDPAIYRIRRESHPRTGDQWCIYPMYDFAHCLSDAIEGITHSFCSLEFQDHRPLYDWFLDQLETECHPQQIEFSRFNLDYTIMSKRKLMELVEEKHVDGWDDPRMPTLSGIRRRGYTPASIRDFCERIGVTKKEHSIEMAQLENCIREDLDTTTKRVMGVLNPIKVIIENYPEPEDENKVELINAPYHPKLEMGRRDIPFTREIYIERDDFMEDPPKKFFRLSPGKEVRLRYAYVIKCNEIIKDSNGRIVKLRCEYDPETKGGKTPDGRKVKGIIHWVSATDSITAEVRLYDRLFSVPSPSFKEKEGIDYKNHLNPDSLQIIKTARLEKSLANAACGDRFQFERQGYFYVDSDKNDNKLFNRTVTLRDTWAKIK